jgi:hypothetical protein
MPTTKDDLAGHKITDLPVPVFRIGQRVKWLETEDRRYFQNQYRIWLRKKWKPGPSNLGHSIIDEAMNRVTQAIEVEIAGVVPSSMYCIDYAEMNQCYLRTAPGIFSGVDYHYQLCIRWEEDGNTLAMITGMPVAGDRDLKLIA